ncbi:MAG: PaaI family thioesterase [Bacteroidales bacterium]
MTIVSTTPGPSSHCFACGSENVNGLHLSFSREPDGSSRAELVTRPDHIGWPDTIHGGILFTIMDEAVAWALHLAGLRGVTAKADVRFRAPVGVGTRLVVTGRIGERNRKMMSTRAELREAEGGKLMAELDATMFAVEG